MKMNSCCRLLFFLTVIFALSGCNLFSPVSPPEKNTYLLKDPVSIQTESAVKTKSKTKKILLVSEINSPSWLDTTQMAYQSNTDQINYFAVNKWAAPPADLLQPIVVHALSASGLYGAVVTAPFAGDYDQRLDIQLLELQQVFTAKSSYYLLTARVQLSNKNAQKIIALKRFHVMTTSAQNTPQSGVLAANQAVKLWISELLEFISANRK
jgi:cholesterol transport system auxiliary component